MISLRIHFYQGENDYTRIRNFLGEVFLLNGRRTLSWPVARLDYWRWHGIYNLGQGSLEQNIFIWETRRGKIAAVLNSEGLGHAFLQIHPTFKNLELVEQMIAHAEDHLKSPSRKGGSVLWVWTDAGDTQRIEILKRRGYIHLSEHDEHQWRRSLKLAVPECTVLAGYTIGTLGDSSQLSSRSWASWRAFHSDEPGEKYQNDWKWYLNIQAAPLYRPDLDLVAITHEGEVAAFTTIWFDRATHSGYFEPVGTVPDHQRSGLARILLCEGMRRLKRLGATICMTAGSSLAANSLYRAVLGPIYDLSQPWEKRWVECTDLMSNVGQYEGRVAR